MSATGTNTKHARSLMVLNSTKFMTLRTNANSCTSAVYVNESDLEAIWYIFAAKVFNITQSDT